jgi:TRAP-type mannitol/chloroaromatic compound transport system permease small subunit
MSENLQKKLPIIMLAMLVIIAIIEVIARFYGSSETKVIVEKSHFVLAVVVLIVGGYLLYVKSRAK